MNHFEKYMRYTHSVLLPSLETKRGKTNKKAQSRTGLFHLFLVSTLK